MMMIKKENQSSSWINKRKIFIYIYIQILEISFFDKKKYNLEKKNYYAIYMIFN